MLKTKKEKKRFLKRDVSENIQYYLMMSIPLILIFLFMYAPMFGLVIAFQDYGAGKPFFGEGVEWVGLKWFKEFLSSYYLPRFIRNTLRLNLMGLAFGFCAPIIFALLLNEIRVPLYKKIIQTISYMPHFISVVIVAGIVSRMIAADGVIMRFLHFMGSDASELGTSNAAFPWIYTFTGVWMGFGWGSILYLSTITSIDPGLYEAAALDGAGRWKRMWHVTLPGMASLIAIQLIMSIGGMLGANMELILNLYNPSIYESADVVSTFVYRESLGGGDFSYGTAIGILMSMFAFALTWTANALSRKFTDWSMW